MLHAEQVGAFLGHENPCVRDHALRSLWLAEAHAGVMADVALDAVARYGAAAFAAPERISHLPMSDKAIARLLAAAENAPAAIAGLFEIQPQAIINQYSAKFPASLRELLAKRIELGSQPAEKLWSMLDPATDNGPVELALALHDEYVAPQVMAILSRAGDPLEPVAINLAGLCHLGQALPQLIRRFSAGGELAEQAVEAVAHLGTAGAVTAIEQGCARGDVAFRIASADCLACIRVPSAEPVLQRLLIEEDDSAAAVSLIRALTDICTTTNYDLVSQKARAGLNIDASTKRAIAALSIMLDRPLPERGAWLVGRPEGNRDLLSALGARIRERPAAAHDYTFATAPQTPAPDPQPKTAPIRRESGKVGRNDPCPCGSGRKYKKCCGA